MLIPSTTAALNNIIHRYRFRHVLDKKANGLTYSPAIEDRSTFVSSPEVGVWPAESESRSLRLPVGIAPQNDSLLQLQRMLL